MPAAIADASAAVSASLAADLRPSWLAVQAAGEAAGQHPMEWPSWAKYVRSLDRALLIVTGEGRRGDTHEEVAIGVVGLLGYRKISRKYYAKSEKGGWKGSEAKSA